MANSAIRIVCIPDFCSSVYFGTLCIDRLAYPGLMVLWFNRLTDSFFYFRLIFAMRFLVASRSMFLPARLTSVCPERSLKTGLLGASCAAR